VTAPVRVHITTVDTALATELTVRSIVACTDAPYELVVYDNSTDETGLMIESFAARGWLRHERTTGSHAEFLDRSVPSCPAQFGVFLHSDVEILRKGWLRRLLAFRERTDAAMVVARIGQEIPGYREPFGRIVRNIGAVDTSVMVFETAKVTEVESSFAFWKEETAEVPEGMRIADVGGMYYRDLLRRGLVVAALPLRLELDYRHWRNLSWRPDWSAALELALRRRLEHLRAVQDGGDRAARLRVALDRTGDRMVVAAHAVKQRVRR
jgi:glycosyltransferase involved in cell wall biosynthesis